MEEYIKVNKSLWNGKTAIHLKSDFYDVEGFKEGRSSLNQIELDALGDVTGKSILHLQCHFGMDSMSWARLSAKVTGIDLSDKAIEAANSLNDELGLDVEFICTDIYDLKNVLDKKFDIIFTSYGTIGWLPDLDKWAGIVSHFLKPGGTFFIAEFHPVIWMFDDNFSKIQYSYFNDEVIIEEIKGSYADKNADFKHNSYGWNHPLSEVINSLITNGLTIKSLEEYSFSYYDCFNNTVKKDDGTFQIKRFEGKLPMMYSIKAVKKSKE